MNSPVLKRILLVEDDADIQTVARLALEAVGGFTVEVCSSGAEALQKAPGFSPDLIMLDVMMPGMDGPSTYQALRAISMFAATPVIFMTAKVQPHEVAQYKNLGVLDVIPKPFDPMLLATTISGIWTQHQVLAVPTGTLEERLEKLAVAYRAQVPEKIRQIEAAWNSFANGAADSSALKDMHIMAHNMAGSASTFKLPQLTEEAHRLELAVSEMMETSAQLTPQEKTRLGTLVEELKSTAGRMTG